MHALLCSKLTLDGVQMETGAAEAVEVAGVAAEVAAGGMAGGLLAAGVGPAEVAEWGAASGAPQTGPARPGGRPCAASVAALCTSVQMFAPFAGCPSAPVEACWIVRPYVGFTSLLYTAAFSGSEEYP